jgi:hypothetical protein
MTEPNEKLDCDPLGALNRLLSQAEELLPQAPRTRHAITTAMQVDIAVLVKVLQHHGYATPSK